MSIVPQDSPLSGNEQGSAVRAILLHPEALFHSEYYSADSPRPKGQYAEGLAHLVQLKNFLGLRAAWRSIDDSFVAQMVVFLTVNLCRHPPQVPAAFLWPDHPDGILLSCSNHWTVLHEVTLLFVRQINTPIEKWAFESLLPSIVTWFGCPDESVRRSVEQLLRGLDESFSDLHRARISLFERRLCLHLTGALPPHAIAPYLSGMLHFYQTNVGRLPQPEWFCQHVVPLYTSPYLPLFSEELQDFCGFIHSYYDDLPPVTVRYLIRRWPVFDSRKLPCFLTAIGRISKELPADARRDLGPAIFPRITQSVGSEHYLVVLGALGLLGDISFLGLFLDLRATIFPPAYRAVRTVLRHFHSDVRQKAGEAVRAMESMTDVTEYAVQQAAPSRSLADKWAPVILANGECEIVGIGGLEKDARPTEGQEQPPPAEEQQDNGQPAPGEITGG